MYPKRTSRTKKVVLITAALLVGVAVLFAAWLYFEPFKNRFFSASEPEPNNEQSNEPTAMEPVFDDVHDVDTTKEITADSPSFTATIPVSWSMHEQDDDGVRIVSPEFTFTTINEEEVTGNFKIYIREGAREQDGEYLGRGYAALPSEELTYTNPASGQRAATNISFFGLDDTSNFAYFFIAGNFSLEEGESLGADYGQDGAYIISGGYSSPEQTDDMATHKVPLDYFNQTNAYKQAVEIIKSLQLQ